MNVLHILIFVLSLNSPQYQTTPLQPAYGPSGLGLTIQFAAYDENNTPVRLSSCETQAQTNKAPLDTATLTVPLMPTETAAQIQAGITSTVMACVPYTYVRGVRQYSYATVTTTILNMPVPTPPPAPPVPNP